MGATTDGEKPVPWISLAAIFVSLTAHATSMTLPFPFLPFMVQSFGYTQPGEIGRYAGLLASALFVGRTLASFPVRGCHCCCRPRASETLH
jgi:biotin transporter BioY